MLCLTIFPVAGGDHAHGPTCSVEREYCLHCSQKILLSNGCNSILREREFSVDHSKQKITTFLMFDGKAEEAMNYYISVFDQAEIVSIQRYGPNEPGAEGTIAHAIFSLYGQVFMCMDSNVKHAFTFTPSISLYVACATEEEIDRLFEKLSQGGEVLMPLAVYPFSGKFGWVADKYGVSWQLNLESNPR